MKRKDYEGFNYFKECTLKKIPCDEMKEEDIKDCVLIYDGVVTAFDKNGNVTLRYYDHNHKNDRYYLI